jgi:hypothetical protein
VDVFFSKEFFGRFLIPSVLVNTPEAHNLMKRIYQMKSTITTLSDISNDPTYTALMAKFPELKDIIPSEVLKMVCFLRPDGFIIVFFN